MKRILLSVVSVFFCIGILSSCQTKHQNNKTRTVAVFIPGIIADSPIYAHFIQGIQDGFAQSNTNAENTRTEVTIFEAGTNQADWSTKLTAIAAEGKYDVIFSSNPSLPDIAAPITAQFPEQKFILADAEKAGNMNIATVNYDQRSQAFLAGAISAMMSKTHKIGLIAAQEYPVMNTIIFPYYKAGAQYINSDCTVDFRVVGNWYDATKGSDLAHAMYTNGEDVILPICGGASQGVISAAKELNFYLTWFDENAYNKAPGHIIACIMADQEKLGKELALEYMENKIVFGTARTVGFTDGYIQYIDSDPLYIQTVPENVRTQMSQLCTSIKNGSMLLPEK